MRWLCPRCGSVVLAGPAPRRDDVRRFCLACSAQVGRLVERHCPVLEAQRTKRAVRAKLREDKLKAAQRAALTWDGVDLRW